MPVEWGVAIPIFRKSCLMQKCFLIAIWFVCTSTYADIVQSNKTSAFGTGFKPLGQSFTATTDESQVGVVSFLTGSITNPSLEAPTITVQLRNGIGYSGSVLGSQTVMSIPSDTPPFTWIDFAFDSPIALTPGQTYTLEFSASNVGTPALSYAACSISLYPGGTMISSNGTLLVDRDLAFRVLSAPEPASILLFLTALVGFIATLRRR